MATSVSFRLLLGCICAAMLWSGTGRADEPPIFPMPSAEQTPETLTVEGLGNLLREMNYPLVNKPDLKDAYLAKIARGGLEIPVLFSLSDNRRIIWVNALLARLPETPPSPRLLALLAKNEQSASFFSYNAPSKFLTVSRPIWLAGESRADIKARIDDSLDFVVKTRSFWDPSRWTEGSVAGTVGPGTPHTVHRPTEEPNQPRSAPAQRGQIISLSDVPQSAMGEARQAAPGTNWLVAFKFDPDQQGRTWYRVAGRNPQRQLVTVSVYEDGGIISVQTQ